MKIMNKFLLIIVSLSSLSLLSADRSADQFLRETESKRRRAADHQQQEAQALANALNAQEDEQEVRDAATYSDDELPTNSVAIAQLAVDQAELQTDAKVQAENREREQTEQDLKAAEAILYELKPTSKTKFKGPGLPKHLQQLVASYALDSFEISTKKAAKVEIENGAGQENWKLFKTIEGLKGPATAKVVGKFVTSTYKENRLFAFDTPAECNVVGKFMVTGESDGNLKLWNINPYECIDQLNLGHAIKSIVANKTGKLIGVSFTDKDIIIIVEIIKDAQQKMKLRMSKVLKDIRPGGKLTFSNKIDFHLPEGDYVGADYDVEIRQNGTYIKGDVEKFVSRIQKKYVTMTESFDVFFPDSNKLRTWDIPSWKEGKKHGEHPWSAAKHYCSFKRVPYDIQFGKKPTKKERRLLNQTVPEVCPAITCLHSRPKNDSSKNLDYVIAGFFDGSIQIFDESLTQVQETVVTGQKGLNGLQSFYSPSQNIAYILSSADDGTIKIWENRLHQQFKTCAYCLKDKHADKATKLMECPCKQIKYCSKECQVADWKNHKLVCPAKKQKNIT